MKFCLILVVVANLAMAEAGLITTIGNALKAALGSDIFNIRKPNCAPTEVLNVNTTKVNSTTTLKIKIRRGNCTLSAASTRIKPYILTTTAMITAAFLA